LLPKNITFLGSPHKNHSIDFGVFRNLQPWLRILKTSLCAAAKKIMFLGSPRKNYVSSGLILLLSFAIVCFLSHSSRITKISAFPKFSACFYVTYMKNSFDDFLADDSIQKFGTVKHMGVYA
jgi:hypothetical protein